MARAQPCPDCGQSFKKTAIRGKRKGYTVLNKGRRGGKIRCNSCGATWMMDKRGAIVERA